MREKRDDARRYIGHLAERLVGEMRRLLVFARFEADKDEAIGDVALFGYHGHATCQSGLWTSVVLERYSTYRG